MSRDEPYLWFPRNFELGAATAAFQVEGAWNVSDKGESIWDRFSHLGNNRVFENSTADVAADSYHKYKEDVQILKLLGFSSYRFSVSWPRILPTGFPNKISADGLQYYHNLIDELVANGIEPLITLYHWDHPQILEEAGGWLNSEMVNWFGDYARVVFQEFGHKVKKFIPINEPTSICVSGYATGVSAPGKRLPGFGEYICIHNTIKAHARAYRIYEEEFKPTQNGQVGFMFSTTAFMPKYASDTMSSEIAFEFNAGWTLHPFYGENGDYPELMKTIVAAVSKQQGYARSRLPEFEPEWINYIRGASDFLAVNHYTSRLVSPGTEGTAPSHDNDMQLKQETDPKWKSSASAWLKVAPEGLRFILRQLKQHYGNQPIYITENGFSDYGGLIDLDRISYYHDYLKQLLLSIHVDDVDVRGYYLWSLIDNFEWSRGYRERFGIVAVDFESPARTRTLKDSAFWWKAVTYTRKVLPVTLYTH